MIQIAKARHGRPSESYPVRFESGQPLSITAEMRRVVGLIQNLVETEGVKDSALREFFNDQGGLVLSASELEAALDGRKLTAIQAVTCLERSMEPFQRIEVATVVFPMMLTLEMIPWVVEETLNDGDDVKNLEYRLRGSLPQHILSELKPGTWQYERV
eukprot:TRINITY_DN7859_c0_g1_i5.p1 TRINITY_DN7859_c0_g1~~TRINITY_DN7859_c0_g1_i5.p1  ORF type:complete len:158 (-),score=10.55 TRINITY_DN7859_c0_g1_i5:37-510(-)